MPLPAVSDAAAAEFLEAARAAFERAAARAGRHEAWFTIAGQRVRVCAAGAALAAYAFPALAHHPADPQAGPPDLDLLLFDKVTTGGALPRPPWPVESFALNGEIVGFASARFAAGFNRGTGLFDFLDTHTGRGLHWISDARQHPAYETSSPLRQLLHWWMRERGLQLAHGGAVGRAAGGVLLVGKGGSGKSTVTLACLATGLQFAGDDYVLFGLAPEPAAYNLYQSAKLNVDHLQARLPQFAAAIRGYTTADRKDKAILFLNDLFPGQLAERLPLRAIVYPRVTGAAAPRLRPADPATVLAGLAPSTVKQLTGLRQMDFDRLAALPARLPGYVLELGGRPETIPAVLAELLPAA
jgi:hypothetical protein